MLPVAGVLVLQLFVKVPPISGWTAKYPLFAVVPVGATFATTLLMVFSMKLLTRRRDLARDRLYEAVRQAEYRVCPRCCFDLRGHGERGTCPECGRPFDSANLRATWAIDAALDTDNKLDERKARYE